MTKVTILGGEPTESKKLKPIKAVACIQAGEEGSLYYTDDYTLLNNESIRVIKINNPSYYSNFDCIIIDDNDAVLIGHFNDGVVE